MLSSRNSGKYLTRRWHRGRDLAMRDGSDTDQTWLELSDHDVSGVHSKETYETETTPIDPLTSPRARDIRDIPERGGKE